MHDTSAYIKPCRIDKNQAPCKSCGAYGVAYRYGPLYYAECSGGKCDTPRRHLHSTKHEAIAEWNRLNNKEAPRMTNFEAITKDPETLAVEIANTCRNLAMICGRKFNSAATAKELAIWLREEAHSPQK